MEDDILQKYIYMVCYNYIPSKHNKIKIKQLFDSLPFFTHEKEIYYDIVYNNPVTLYYNKAKIIDYSYILYKKYMEKKKLKYLEYDEYKKTNEYNLYINKEDRYNIDKTIRFRVCIFIIICLYFICMLKTG